MGRAKTSGVTKSKGRLSTSRPQFHILFSKSKLKVVRINRCGEMGLATTNGRSGESRTIQTTFLINVIPSPVKCYRTCIIMYLTRILRFTTFRLLWNRFDSGGSMTPHLQMILLRASILLVIVGIAVGWPTGARGQGCPYPIQGGYHCSDAQTHCNKDIVLFVCQLSGSSNCCTTTGTHVDCCGDLAQNSAEGGPCDGRGGCKGGLIADPKTGRIARACFGEFVYQKAEPTKASPQAKSPAMLSPSTRQETSITSSKR